HPARRVTPRWSGRSPLPLRAEVDPSRPQQAAPRVRSGGGRPVSRVAVVTGGASGIGLGVARRFIADGHRVALLDCDGSAAKAAADELVATGGSAVAVEVDVADRSSVDAAFEQVRAELGPTEILVTSAGIESFTSLLDITMDK